jgi:CRP-like cAMP-binding protein
MLTAAKSGLVCLKANDWVLIADKAARRRFESGDRIVRRGAKVDGLYILLKGSASARLSPHGGPRTIGPGDVCGEISFLDGLPASADVVAEEAVETYFLDRPTLQTLIELFPHLGSRLYQSLAAILTRRLRDVIEPPAARKQANDLHGSQGSDLPKNHKS